MSNRLRGNAVGAIMARLRVPMQLVSGDAHIFVGCAPRNRYYDCSVSLICFPRIKAAIMQPNVNLKSARS